MNEVMKEVWIALAKFAAVGIIALILLAIGKYGERRSAIEERAAYLEGRFGIDHATAMVFAEEEVGSAKAGHQES